MRSLASLGGIVMTHYRGIALGAELAVIRGIAGVAFNLVDNPFIRHVDKVAAGVQTHLATGCHPASAFERICCGFAASHTQAL